MKQSNLTIGNLKLNYPFVLAPLAGITDRSMRSLCYQAGASLTYTEMVSAKGLWYGDRKTAELLAIGPEEGPVGYQLFGSEPQILGYAVRILSDPLHAKAVDAQMERAWEEAGSEDIASRPPMGARTVDLLGAGRAEPSGPAEGAQPDVQPDAQPGMDAGIPARPALFDLNAGCPVPKIVKNGEGSALLKDPQLVHDCISAMCDATTIPVTIKIRKGFEHGDNCAVEIAKAAEAAGATAITVHGRTRQQFYDGKADWEAIAAVKKAVKIPVIGNGDVMSGADALRMMDETGCDGVMIARGALGNPWIFEEACALWDERGGAGQAGEAGQTGKTEQTGQAGNAACGAAPETFHPPTDEERIALLLQHIDLVCADKGEHIAVREMRKHIGWYIKGMHGATRIRREINAINDAEEMKRVLRTLLRP